MKKYLLMAATIAAIFLAAKARKIGKIEYLINKFTFGGNLTNPLINLFITIYMPPDLNLKVDRLTGSIFLKNLKLAEFETKDQQFLKASSFNQFVLRLKKFESINVVEFVKLVRNNGFADLKFVGEISANGITFPINYKYNGF